MTQQTVAAGQLRAFVERIERMQEERKTIAEDIAEVIKEAVGTGFDRLAIKAVLKIRSVDDGIAKWQENSAILDLYLGALGMLPAPAGARAHVENIEEFRAKATEDNGTYQAHLEGHGVTGVASRPVSGRTETATSEAMDATAGETALHFEPPAFLKRDHAPLRPLCQNPDDCAGYGRTHCHACLKASGEVEAA